MSSKYKCSCPFCKEYRTEGKKHVDSEGTRLHSCHYENCGKIFKKSSTLRKHLLRTHTEGNNINHEWPGCGKRIYVKSGVKVKHSPKHTGERSYACQWPGCGKKCIDQRSLRLHFIHMHTEQGPFGCKWPKCKRRFFRKDGLDAHMLTHSEEEKYMSAYKRYKTCQKRKRSRRKNTSKKKEAMPVVDSTRELPDSEPTEIEEVNIVSAEPETQLESDVSEECNQQEEQQIQILPDQLKHQLQDLDLWWPKDLKETDFPIFEMVEIEEDFSFDTT